MLGRVLLDREGFSGQQRLIDEEIAARQQHSVGRYHVAGGKPDDVAGTSSTTGRLASAPSRRTSARSATC